MPGSGLAGTLPPVFHRWPGENLGTVGATDGPDESPGAEHLPFSICQMSDPDGGEDLAVIIADTREKRAGLEKLAELAAKSGLQLTAYLARRIAGILLPSTEEAGARMGSGFSLKFINRARQGISIETARLLAQMAFTIVSTAISGSASVPQGAQRLQAAWRLLYNFLSGLEQPEIGLEQYRRFAASIEFDVDKEDAIQARAPFRKAAKVIEAAVRGFNAEAAASGRTLQQVLQAKAALHIRSAHGPAYASGALALCCKLCSA